MGFSLAPGLQEAITQFDPTVEILWNNRIKRWVVACWGHSLHRVAPALLGVVRIATEKTHYTPIFVCEMDPPGKKDVEPGFGVPVVPEKDWILGRLIELRKYKHRTEREYDQQIAAEDEARENELQRKIDDVNDNFTTEMLKYGKRGDDIRSRRNVWVENNDHWRKPEEATAE